MKLREQMVDVDILTGCLLGEAIGDMMGLAAENMSPRRIAKLYRNFDRPHFLFGWGMGSDDTEHACMTLLALIDSDQSSDAFRRRLARRIRWWFLFGPAGIGRATIRSCVKLWLGVPSAKSGVWSAGNGPAMRSTVLGLCAKSAEELSSLVRESTRITHTDPKAECGALVAALAVREFSHDRDRTIKPLGQFLGEIDPVIGGNTSWIELRRLLQKAEEGLKLGSTTREFARLLGLERGVKGYMYHTIPVAIFASWRNADDYRSLQ